MITERSNAILLPFTLALLATAACGGSTTNNASTQDSGAAAEDSGSMEDSGAPQDAQPDTHVAADTGTTVDSGSVEVDGGKFVAVPLDMCGPALQYAATATIGTEQFQLVLDTGSAALGVAGSTCSNCDVTPEYTPGSTAMDEMQTATEAYGTGQWTGEIYQDNVSLDPSLAVPVKFGAMTTQSMFLEMTTCQTHASGVQGIVGFALPGATSSPGTTPFFDIYQPTENIPDLFAIDLCETGGTLWLGGFDGTKVTAAPKFTPLIALAQAQLYLVDFESIAVGTASAQIGTATAPSLVDTGTSIFVLPTAAYTTITGALEGNAAFTQIFGANFFPTSSSDQVGPCVNLAQTKAQLDAMLPPITLTLGTGSSAVTVDAAPTDSYLYFAGGQAWCNGLAEADLGQSGLSAIMGAPILKSSVIIFDRGNQQIGFAPKVPCN
jgi:hypothetical protein